MLYKYKKRAQLLPTVMLNRINLRDKSNDIIQYR